jgi:hypothetical protein
MGASMAATRIGIDQGKSKGDLEKFIAEEMAKPGSESWRLGLGKSLLLTFQDDPGPLAKGVNIMRENVPGPRWLMPFVTVVGNILNMGFAKSPLGGITLMHKVAQAGMVKYVPNSTVAKSPSDIVLRGQQIQRGMAEQVIAWVFTLALWDFLNDEDDEDLPRITGSIAPGAERWRQPWMDGVIQPNSIRIKGKYYSFIRLEPVGTTLGLIVDGLVAAQAAKDGKDMNEALGKAFREMSQVALDKTFLYGLSDLMESMRSDKGAMQWVQNFTTSFAPNIIRSSLRAADPHIPSYKITESRTKYPEGVIENLAHRAFPLPKAGPPKKRNIWGKKIDRSASDQPLSSFLIRLVMPVIIMDTKDTRHVDYMILRINEKADSGTLNKRDEPMKPLLMGWPPSNGERRGFGKYEMTRKEYALFIERRGEIAWRMLKNRFSERQILDPGERERQTIMSAFRKATDRARTEYLRGIKR